MNAPEREAWRDEHFPDRERPTGEIVDRLPTPKDRDEARRQAQVRNPTVVRVQNEMRKVVNNLIGLYGKPDLIRIELARQIGKSKREREEMSAAIRRNEREREKARADLKANGLPDPSDPDIEKWLLWKECGKECPYTRPQHRLRRAVFRQPAVPGRAHLAAFEIARQFVSQQDALRSRPQQGKRQSDAL